MDSGHQLQYRYSSWYRGYIKKHHREFFFLWKNFQVAYSTIKYLHIKIRQPIMLLLLHVKMFLYLVGYNCTVNNSAIRINYTDKLYCLHTFTTQHTSLIWEELYFVYSNFFVTFTSLLTELSLLHTTIEKLIQNAKVLFL